MNFKTKNVSDKEYILYNKEYILYNLGEIIS